jgi:mannose-1-phosphate guanylyltransferase
MIFRCSRIPCDDSTASQDSARQLPWPTKTTAFLVAEQLLEIGLKADILLEPAARNTAPAVAAAALQALCEEGEKAAPLLLVLPSDHVIGDVVAFQDAVRGAIPHASAGALVTFGVLAERPETGYGYIRRGDPVSLTAMRSRRFVEKTRF